MNMKIIHGQKLASSCHTKLALSFHKGMGNYESKFLMSFFSGVIFKNLLLCLFQILATYWSFFIRAMGGKGRLLWDNFCTCSNNKKTMVKKIGQLIQHKNNSLLGGVLVTFKQIHLLHYHFIHLLHYYFNHCHQL